MDAATWLRQMGGESAQAEKRAQLAELCTSLAGLATLDDLLFDGMERTAAFFGAERAAVFIPDLENQLRAVAWVSESVRELRLPREPTNLVGWAFTTHAPASVRNVWDLAELVRLHPRLRPDDRLDQWLNLRLRSVILAPLLDREQVAGILLVANRTRRGGSLSVAGTWLLRPDVAKAIAGNLGAQLGQHTPASTAVATTPAPAKRAVGTRGKGCNLAGHDGKQAHRAHVGRPVRAHASTNDVQAGR